MDEPTPTTAPANPPAAPLPDPEAPRKIAGRLISIAALVGVVILVSWVWEIIEQHPRTDDAFATANVIGVTPRVHGPIIRLNVQDNQEVKVGDLLFEIDPADYEVQRQNAAAALAAAATSGASPVTRHSWRLLWPSSRAWAMSGISSRRSRSGGRRNSKTFRRK